MAPRCSSRCLQKGQHLFLLLMPGSHAPVSTHSSDVSCSALDPAAQENAPVTLSCTFSLLKNLNNSLLASVFCNVSHHGYAPMDHLSLTQKQRWLFILTAQPQHLTPQLLPSDKHACDACTPLVGIYYTYMYISYIYIHYVYSLIYDKYTYNYIIYNYIHIY